MSDTKSKTIRKANTKKAAMKNVAYEIAEFGIKNMEAGSKARGSRNASAAKPKINVGVDELARKGGPSKIGPGKGSHAYAKKKSF